MRFLSRRGNCGAVVHLEVTTDEELARHDGQDGLREDRIVQKCERVYVVVEEKVVAEERRREEEEKRKRRGGRSRTRAGDARRRQNGENGGPDQRLVES